MTQRMNKAFAGIMCITIQGRSLSSPFTTRRMCTYIEILIAIICCPLFVLELHVNPWRGAGAAYSRRLLHLSPVPVQPLPH